ncbi:MAG TPA: hypothetical protein VMU19_02935 [Bryobacteraceae bacterium]|nr:hypothetical protein [Bryobacteraceae bacterium]
MRTLLSCATVILAAVCVAQADVSVVVPATTDIWLAGQPNGASVAGYFGTDFAPANSPIAINVTAGSIIRFSASDGAPVSVDGTCFDTAADAGVCYADEFGFSAGDANGISLAHVPAGALVGVFVAAGGPSGPTPLALDFSTSGIGTAFTSLSPALDQLFFIGDGWTGTATGSGSQQLFTAPAGAGTLYLAVSDSVGSSVGNSGYINADVQMPEPGAVPLLASQLGGGLLVLFALRRRLAK